MRSLLSCTELLRSCQFLVYKQTAKLPNGLFDNTKTHKVQQRTLIKPFMTTATELQKAQWHFRRGKQLAESVCAHTGLTAHWVMKKKRKGNQR